MFTIETSMPRTARAKAAVATGMGMPAILLDIVPGLVWHAEYRSDCRQLGNGSYALGIGSAGATVT
jgi:hypothetical protein